MGHHYGEDSIHIVPRSDGYDVNFINKETGQRIRMYIPASNIFENAPHRVIQPNEVENLARDIAHRLRDNLK